MSDHDMQLLALGTTLGMYIMLFVQIVGDFLDDRRDRKAVRAAEAQLAARVAVAGGKISAEDLAATRGAVPNGAVLTADAVRTARDSA